MNSIKVGLNLVRSENECNLRDSGNFVYIAIIMTGSLIREVLRVSYHF